jgi:sec-independent protein translocase protein TatA
MDLGPTELLIILAVILLLFGGAKLPQLARSLGQAKKEFQDGATEAGKETPAAPSTPTSTDPS